MTLISMSLRSLRIIAFGFPIMSLKIKSKISGEQKIDDSSYCDFDSVSVVFVVSSCGAL